MTHQHASAVHSEIYKHAVCRSILCACASRTHGHLFLHVAVEFNELYAHVENAQSLWTLCKPYAHVECTFVFSAYRFYLRKRMFAAAVQHTVKHINTQSSMTSLCVQSVVQSFFLFHLAVQQGRINCVHLEHRIVSIMMSQNAQSLQSIMIATILCAFRVHSRFFCSCRCLLE